MFEGFFIGRYSKKGSPVKEGDIVSFVFHEPGKYTGYQIGEARGVVVYNNETSSFEIAVNTETHNYSEYIESKYATKLSICVFNKADISKFPVIEVTDILGTIHSEVFDLDEIKETIDELVVLRNLSSVNLSQKANVAIFNSIDILNKVKNKFTVTN